MNRKMLHRRCAATVVVCALVALPTAALAQAQPHSPAEKVSAETKSWLDRYTAAFNAGDAAKLGEYWLPEAEFVPIGGRIIDGRENIAKVFGEFFAKHPGVKLSLEPRAERQLSPDARIVDVRPVLLPPPDGQPTEVLTAMVLVRKDNRWMIHSVRDTMSEAPAERHLDVLKGFVGQWRASQGEPFAVEGEAEWHWTGNKSFLILTFSFMHNGASHRGMEVIGWDEADDVIRSWTFDSNGGFTSGVWKGEKGNYTITSQGVLADGQRVTSTNKISKIDDNTIEFSSVDRTRDGKPEVEVPPIRLTRMPLSGARQGILPAPATALPGAKPAAALLPAAQPSSGQ